MGLAVACVLNTRAQRLIEAHGGTKCVPGGSPNHGMLGDVHVLRVHQALLRNVVRIDPDILPIIRQACILRRSRLLSEIRGDERWARAFFDGERNVQLDVHGRPISDDQLLDQALRSAVQDVREPTGLTLSYPTYSEDG